MTAVRTAHTGPGPMPGTDPREAARVVLGECPDTPFLPELADRGIGADAVGRTGALLADLPLDVSTRGWRLARSLGRPARRAADLLHRDTDALEEADELARGVTVDRAVGGSPSSRQQAPERRLQVRLLGPWSLAALLELPSGPPVLTDHGARRDLAASLAQGAADVAVRLSGRLGAGARILLDEPLLWHVAEGAVRGPSRLDPLPAVPSDRLALSLCRFGDALRSAGVEQVLLRAPVATTTGPGRDHLPAAHWSVVTEPPRGETPLDGLCLSTELLRGVGPRDRPAADERAVTDGRRAVHAALDAAGSVLGDGRLLQLEGVTSGGRTGDTRGGDPDPDATDLFALLDRLGAPRHESLARLILTPGTEQVSHSLPAATRALAAVRRLAGIAPSLGE